MPETRASSAANLTANNTDIFDYLDKKFELLGETYLEKKLKLKRK